MQRTEVILSRWQPARDCLKVLGVYDAAPATPDRATDATHARREMERKRESTVKTRNKAAFTRNELIAVVAVVALLALVLYPAVHASIEQAISTSMKSRGRGIWTSVLSANAERRLLGPGVSMDTSYADTNDVWPRALGFDASKTSTEYFRMLMSTDSACMTNGLHGPICEDLKPSALGGAGVPCANSVSEFTSRNNAWNVVCEGMQGTNSIQSEMPFLIRSSSGLPRSWHAQLIGAQ